MTNIEIEKTFFNPLNIREKVHSITTETNTIGNIETEGEFSSLKFQRRLFHPIETVWKEITDPKRLYEWMNTKAIMNAKSGGTIDFVNTISGYHTMGDILTWEPNRVYEHE